MFKMKKKQPNTTMLHSDDAAVHVTSLINNIKQQA